MNPRDKARWQACATLDDIREAVCEWICGGLAETPVYHGGPHGETRRHARLLCAVNRAGLLTDGMNDEPDCSCAYLYGLIPPSRAPRLYVAARRYGVEVTRTAARRVGRIYRGDTIYCYAQYVQRPAVEELERCRLVIVADPVPGRFSRQSPLWRALRAYAGLLDPRQVLWLDLSQTPLGGWEMIKRYADWCRRHGANLQCNPPAMVGGVLFVALSVLAIAYLRVIEEILAGVLIAIACAVGVTVLSALGYGIYRLRRWLAARHAKAAAQVQAQPAPSPAASTAEHLERLAADWRHATGAPLAPCARGCGRPADTCVQWANGIRSGEENLCTPCYQATELADRAELARQEAEREALAARLAVAPASPVPPAADQVPGTDRDLLAAAEHAWSGP